MDVYVVSEALVCVIAYASHKNIILNHTLPMESRARSEWRYLATIFRVLYTPDEP